jgi:hypothetical protein
MSQSVIKTFEEVSSYNFTTPISFYKVDCFNKTNLCIDYSIGKNLPQVKVILNGKETNYIPTTKETEGFLEYVDKIISNSIIELNTMKAFLDFTKNYGDVSFVLIDDEESNCYQDIAEQYKPVYYFGFIKKNIFKNNYNIQLPAIIVILLI